MSDLPPPEPLVWELEGRGSWLGRTRSLQYRIQEDETEASPGRYRLSIIEVHGPEWWHASLDEAKAKAEEINSSAPLFEDEDWRPLKWPAVISDGDQVRALKKQPPTPSGIATCEHCGSTERPILMKPLRYTPEWWDDPDAYWICPACDRIRGGSGI